MYRRPKLPSTVWLFLMSALGIAGCTSPVIPPPLPPAAQIAKLRFTVLQFPAGVTGKVPCVVTLTEGDDFDGLIAWLHNFDWSQPGMDLTPVKVPAPDGEIALTAQDGSTYEFDFYWDGRVIDRGGNRLYSGGNPAPLQAFVQRACK